MIKKIVRYCRMSKCVGRCSIACIVVLVVVLTCLQVLHMAMLNRLEVKRDPANVRKTQRKIELTGVYHSIIDAIDSGQVMDSSGQYRIVSFLLRSRYSLLKHAAKTNNTSRGVTLVSQCSANHLYRLIDQHQAWTAPISVSVFATSKHVSVAIEILLRLYYCVPSIFDNVSIHLVYPLTPLSLNMPLSRITSIDDNMCVNLYETLEHQSSIANNYGWGGVPYPNNLLRNVALDNSETNYVFVVDIDMIPVVGLSHEFANFVVDRHSSERTVYVVPAFEIRNRTQIPVNKRSLLHQWNMKLVRPFYQELCWKCQRHTNYSMWRNLSIDEPLGVGFEALWKDPWEPFYIAPRSIPRYDERFRQYGFNRISQSCELHVAGYQFVVLNNAFLLHRGFKTSTGFHSNKDQEQEQNRQLFRLFKKELKTKYPDSERRCY